MSAADHALVLEQPYKQGDPLDLSDARAASRRLSQMRRAAEAELRAAVDTAGQAEGTYRERLAKEIVAKRADNPATLAVDLAKGEPHVQEAMIAFRIAQGMVDAHKERLRTLEGERSQLKSLIDWSANAAVILQQLNEQDRENQPGTVARLERSVA